MSKAQSPGKSAVPTPIELEDIPAARRVTPTASKRSASRTPLAVAGGILGLGALALGIWTLSLGGSSPSPVVPPASEKTETLAPTPPPKSAPPAAENAKSDRGTEPAETVNILGHLSYEDAEAPPGDLTAITRDGRIKLRTAAARKFQEMEAAARSQGIILTPLSGYRSIPEQEYLFFEIKAQRGQDARTRAEVSAPPGYSEHHTGYAIDIGDGRTPATHLEENFEKTEAFAWLEANAARYSFELSFPRNNPQGIAYEPWHWRFVGDRESLETFYKARQLPSASNSTTEQ